VGELPLGFHAYEACVSVLERVLLRDSVPANRVPSVAWALADAYLRKGAHPCTRGVL
jgi:hypothetical protein